MKKIKNSIVNFIRTRKILSFIVLALLLGGGYWVYAKTTSTAGTASYVLSKVSRGDIITTISGTGQVSASSQVDIKSKVTGDLTYLNTSANGQQIKKGTLLAQVDTKDAAITLENARIAYEKALKPASASTMLQAENAVSDAIISNKKSYEDGFTALTNTFTDLPTVMTGLNNLLYSRTGYLQSENLRTLGQTALDYQSKAGLSYDLSNNEYTSLLVRYKDISRTSATSTIQSFVADTYLIVRDISETIKNAQNALDFARKQKNDSTGDAPANTLSSWATTVNSNLSSLLSAQTTMSSSFQTIAQKTADLNDLKNGTDALDIRSQQLALQQKENDYQDYFIRAPFDGLLARISLKASDSVSPGTVIGTLVSTQKITTITLNEVDVSKVHVEQKAKLTFDAIDGLIIDGTVTAVDLVGTVTQGVVNYNVEIVLDTQDDRIKSGMSVSASIIVETKEAVLKVPNSAIKTQGNFSYVEMFATPLLTTKGTVGTPSKIAPLKKKIEIGLSNDTSTEIISGVNEGDQIVIRTIAASAAKAATATAPSLFGSGARTGTGATGTGRTGGNATFQRN